MRDVRARLVRLEITVTLIVLAGALFVTASGLRPLLELFGLAH